MLLLFAFPTKSSEPSGVRQRLLGVFPAGAPGKRAHEIVCSVLPLAVSSTLTLVELAQATKSILPSGERTISVGWRSVSQVATTAFFSRSMTATADFNQSVVHTRFPRGSARQVYG